MLRGLSERGIRPMITLHHFAHPVWLEVLGGFGALADEALGPLQKLIDKKDTPDAVKEAAKASIQQIKSAQKPNK